MLVTKDIYMLTILFNIKNLNYKLQVFILLLLYIPNQGVLKRRDLIRLWIIMLINSYKDPNSYKHLDFLSISKFKTLLAIFRVKR